MTPPPEEGGGGSTGGNGGGSGSGASSTYSLPLLRPKPQRHWQITPISTEPPTPRSRSTDIVDGGKPVPRTRSILNLTSPTLFGIYKDDTSQPPTPWGPGSMTPAMSSSPRDSISEDAQRRGALGAVDPAAYRSPPKYTTSRQGRQLRRTASPVPSLTNIAILAALGLLYGLALARLHAYTHIIPVRLAALEHYSLTHLAFWAVAAVASGVGLPALDRWWQAASSRSGSGSGSSSNVSSGSTSPREREHGEMMISVMRCVGGFVGIAFAIRKLPWEATLQATLTLTLSNPILWYLVDGSASGLLLSTSTGLAGAGILIGVQPAYDAPKHAGSSWGTATGRGNATSALPGPFGASVAPEVLALAAYVGSALFYCVVCFGNVGRALAYR